MTPFGDEIAVAIAGSPALSLIAKATVVCAAALVLARFARRRRASVRHLMCATTFIVLLALPLVPAVAPARQVTLPLLEPAQVIADVAPAPVLSAPVGIAQSVDTIPAAAGRQLTLPSLSTVLLMAWIGGTAIVLVPMIAGLVRVRRVRRHGLPWRDGQLLVASIASALAVRRPIQVLLDDAADGPMTCGIVRPAVILPRDARQWAMEDLRRAIVHELEHVRRGDWLTLCLARFVCAVYWFHPLVWMLWRQLRLEAERACDDAVLRSEDPETYADQLVTLAERLVSNRAQSALAMADRDDLSARVSAVLDGRQPRGRAGSIWVAGAAIAAALLITAIAPLRAVAIARGLPASVADTVPDTAAVVTTQPPVAPALNAPVVEEAPPEPAGLLAAVSPAAAAAAEPQSVPARPAEAPIPRFLVASVKVNTSGRVLPSLPRLTPGRVTIENVGLRQLINLSHDIQPFQLVGLPGWAEDARFDINATSRDTASPAELLQMVRALLTDRFQLVTRREARLADLYTLEQLSPGSSKLKPSQADCAAVANMPVEQAVAAAGPDPSGRQGGPGSTRCQIFPMTGRGRVIATGARISNLTNILTNVVGRQVVDNTGLEGPFDMNLTWTPVPGMQAAPAGLPVPPPADPGAPSIFTALQEQLGLRLVTGRGPVEMLVVERLELPTPD